MNNILADMLLAIDFLNLAAHSNTLTLARQYTAIACESMQFTIHRQMNTQANPFLM